MANAVHNNKIEYLTPQMAMEILFIDSPTTWRNFLLENMETVKRYGVGGDGKAGKGRKYLVRRDQIDKAILNSEIKY